MEKIELVIDRNLAGLKEKVNKLADQGYAPEGSFNRTKDGRWFMQTMVLKDAPQPAGEPQGSADVEGKAEVSPSTPKRTLTGLFGKRTKAAAKADKATA